MAVIYISLAVLIVTIAVYALMKASHDADEENEKFWKDRN